MNKKKFLETLEKELIHNRCADIDNILEYYEELIEDKKENGKKEKDIIDSLDIAEIIKNVKVEQKIDDAVRRPTVSNGVKALIASLSILSLPMLIPVGVVIFAFIITVVALLFALVITIGSIIFAGGISIVAFVVAAITGKLSFAATIFSIGCALVLIGLFSSLIKWAIKISKEFIAWTADFLKVRFNKRKEDKDNE